MSGNRKGCPYGMIYFSNSCEAPTSFHYSLFAFHSSLPVRACNRPTAVDYKIGKSTEKRPLCLKYEIYSGKSGSIQGEMKEINPSKKVITNSMSVSFVCQSKRDKRYPYPSASIFSKGIKRSAALLIQ